MARRLTCPQGHEWEVSEELPVSGQRVVCPLCGTVTIAFAGEDKVTLPSAPAAPGADAEAAGAPLSGGLRLPLAEGLRPRSPRLLRPAIGPPFRVTKSAQNSAAAAWAWCTWPGRST